MRGNKAGVDDRNTNAAFQPMYNVGPLSKTRYTPFLKSFLV